MDDLISRQAAIDTIEREKSLVERPITETRWFDLGLSKAQDVLSELPSAEKKAKILNANPVGECSACGWLIDYRDGFNYCPGCGARLEEEHE